MSYAGVWRRNGQVKGAALGVDSKKAKADLSMGERSKRQEVREGLWDLATEDCGLCVE